MKHLQWLRLLLAFLFRILNFFPKADLMVSFWLFFFLLITPPEGALREEAGQAGLADATELDVLDGAEEGVFCMDEGTSLNSPSVVYC
jgi:hypothetical protein